MNSSAQGAGNFSPISRTSDREIKKENVALSQLIFKLSHCLREKKIYTGLYYKDGSFIHFKT